MPDSETLLRDVLSRIAAATGHGAPERPDHKGFFNLRCPAHEDASPSLGVKAGDNGIVLKCLAGCGARDIAGAIGMEMRELFFRDDSSEPKAARRPRSISPPISVKALADDKRLPFELLRDASVEYRGDVRCWSEKKRSWYEARGVVIGYKLLDGSPAPRQRLRTALKAKDGSRWAGRDDDGPLVPYGLWRLAGRENVELAIVEGESDCWTLWHHGFDALGIPGMDVVGSLSAEHVAGVATVYVVAEADKAGAKFPHKIAARLAKLKWPGELRVVEMRKPFKDPNDIHKADPAAFPARWRELFDAAPLYVEPEVDASPNAPAPPTGAEPGTRASAGRDDRRWKASRDMEPEDVAEAFLEDALPPRPPSGGASGNADRVGLVFHRDQFYRYTGQGYRRWPMGELRANVMRYIQTSGQGKPAKTFVTNVVENLGGMAAVSYSLVAPAWISTGDSAGRVLCVTNGLLDVSTDPAELRPHTPDLFSLNALPYAYDPAAACPRWQTFLREMLPDADLRALLQEWFGYCLIPSQEYQRLLLMQGEGANGKSIVQAILRGLVGAENCSSVSLEGIHLPHATAPLVGSLVNFSAEFGRIDPMGEGILKQISGGDCVTIDPKFQSAYESPLFCRFVVTSNNPPRITDRSDGLWRRLIVLPFGVRIPVDLQRPLDDMLAELTTEMSGVLVWALEGLARLRKRGRFVDNAATAAVKCEYRQLSNPAQSWCDEWLELDATYWEPVDSLYKAYLDYAKGEGHQGRLTKPNLGKEIARWMRDRSGETLRVVQRRTADFARIRVYAGLRLRAEPVMADAEPWHGDVTGTARAT